jgi:pimeloyl-ACP methyl ester carboxylesterase
MMARLFLILFSLSMGLSQAFAAPMCSDIFSDDSAISPRGFQKFYVPNSDRVMIYDYKKASPGKDTLVLIHGLGDDMTKLRAVAQLADQDGLGVLLMDLNGHGRTLHEYLAHHDNTLPDHMDYQDNVNDVTLLIQSLLLTKISLLGHSYGGGIAFGVAAKLQASGSPIQIRSLHMVAPYVQRIDKFLSDYFQSPQYLINQTAKAWEKAGVPPALSENIFDIFFQWTWTITSQMRLFKDGLQRALHLDYNKDLLMDPFVEKFMRKNYRKYFVAVSKKRESELSTQESDEIDIKVEAAIKITKGIRGFDLLDETTSLPSSMPPLQIIGGKEDQLVLPVQLKNFDRRLQQEGIGHKLVFISGKKSHHLFPQTMPDQLYQQVRNFRSQQQP